MKEKGTESGTPQAVDINSDEREGNDVAALVGSGAPMVEVRARVGCMGMAAGETTTMPQTEEVRLNVQNEYLEVLDRTEQ